MTCVVSVLGIDLGKNSCSLAGLDASGAVIKRRRMRPESITEFTPKLASDGTAGAAAMIGAT